MSLARAAAVLARVLGADEVSIGDGGQVGPLALALDPRAIPLVLVHVRRVLAPAVAAARHGADLQAVADALGAMLGAYQVTRAAHRALLVQLEAGAAAGE